MSKKKSAEGLLVPEPRQVPLSTVNMSPYNPRYMPPHMMRALEASLVKHGMVLNLVVQAKSEAHGPMIVIGGHQRVTAMKAICKRRGWPEPERVTAVVLDLPDVEAKQLNVALNNIEGEFDPARLGAMFAEIGALMSAEDILATGFDRENIEELCRLAAPPDDAAAALESEIGEITGFANSITLSLEFSTAEKRDEAKAVLRELAGARKRKAGDLVLDMAKAGRAAKRGR